MIAPIIPKIDKVAANNAAQIQQIYGASAVFMGETMTSGGNQ
jgi:hypothetical protein